MPLKREKCRLPDGPICLLFMNVAYERFISAFRLSSGAQFDRYQIASVIEFHQIRIPASAAPQIRRVEIQEIEITQ
jgi:hypothetical protein